MKKNIILILMIGLIIMLSGCNHDKGYHGQSSRPNDYVRDIFANKKEVKEVTKEEKETSTKTKTNEVTSNTSEEYTPIMLDDYFAKTTDNNDGTFTVVLGGNPTTGYEWSKYETGGNIEIDCDNGVYSSSNDKNLDGAGGYYTFTLIPKTLGHESADLGYISFQYKRSWENYNIAIYEVNFIIDGDENVIIDCYK